MGSLGGLVAMAKGISDSRRRYDSKFTVCSFSGFDQAWDHRTSSLLRQKSKEYLHSYIIPRQDLCLREADLTSCENWSSCEEFSVHVPRFAPRSWNSPLLLVGRDLDVSINLRDQISPRRSR